MTIDEVEVCADIFVGAAPKFISARARQLVKSTLVEECSQAAEKINDIEPGDMRKLFCFFEGVIQEMAKKELEILGVSGHSQEGYGGGLTLEELQRFKNLTIFVEDL